MNRVIEIDIILCKGKMLLQQSNIRSVRLLNVNSTHFISIRRMTFLVDPIASSPCTSLLPEVTIVEPNCSFEF